MSRPIQRGDVLKIAPAWQDEGDEEKLFIAEDNEEKGRVTIRDMGNSDYIPPTQVVAVEMVEIYKRRDENVSC